MSAGYENLPVESPLVAAHASESATRDADLPGPRTPASLQTLQWIVKPPLRWMLRLSARFGETFRLRVIGTTAVSEGPRRKLRTRTVVVTSSPTLLKEAYARPRAELLAGEVQDFIAWHIGEDSILVVDGARQIEERRALHSALMRVDVANLTRTAVRRSFAEWPDRGVVPLQQLMNRAVLDAALVCTFGPLEPHRLQRLRHLAESGAITTSVSPILLVLASLQADGRRWLPAYRVHRVVSEFEDLVAAEVAKHEQSRNAKPDGSLIGALATQCDDSPDLTAERRLIVQRVRTLLGGMHTGSVAAAWCAYHLGQNPDVLDRARSAALGESDGGEAFLEAIVKEVIRLNPPFLGGFRLVAEPTTFGGISFRRGTTILPNVAALHRRADVHPEPTRFRPERFLEHTFPPSEYAPFGGGVRRCLGEAMVLQQLRILIEELVTGFDIRPTRLWNADERRAHLVLLPTDPLPADVRRRGANRDLSTRGVA